jgi:chaperonin GroEL (HSP60 family)
MNPWVLPLNVNKWFRDDDFFANIVVDAMLAVKNVNPRGEVKYPVKAVNILKAHGKSSKESTFIPGYALNCTVASQGMSPYIFIPFFQTKIVVCGVC